MPNIQTTTHKKNPTAKLKLIQQKRNALQNLMKLSNMLNHLHQGLQSVIFMGKSPTQLPKPLLNKFTTLKNGLKSQSTTVLKNTLFLTDKTIERDIKQILEISQKSDFLLEKQLTTTENSPSQVVKNNYHEYIDDFKKKSHTSILLRITLETRNESIKIFQLPVPKSFVKKQIINLNKQEKQCIQHIKKNMHNLQSDVSVLINDDDYPDKIKATLLKIQDELKTNNKQIDAGVAIDKLPMLCETIELSAEPQSIEEVEQIINKVPPQIEENDSIKTSQNNSPINKLNFFQHLWKWLNSSWNTNWKDI